MEVHGAVPKPTREAATRLARGQITERLVDATTKLLADKGRAEIKARSVAEAARVSTMAVYYHVGGLPELLQAVVDRGFRDLDLACEAVRPSDDPVADLFTTALSSRRLAQRNPHLYDLVFGLSTRGSYRPLQSPTPRHQRTIRDVPGRLCPCSPGMHSPHAQRPHPW